MTLNETIQSLFRTESGPDGYRIRANSDLRAGHQQISALLEEVDLKIQGYSDRRISTIVKGQFFLRSSPEEQIVVLRAALERFTHVCERVVVRDMARLQQRARHQTTLKETLKHLLRGAHLSRSGDLIPILDVLAASPRIITEHHFPLASVLTCIERLDEEVKLEPEVVHSLNGLRQALQHCPNVPHKVIDLVIRLSGGSPLASIEPGEPWARLILEALESMSPSERSAWIDLLQHAYRVTGSLPGPVWLKDAGANLDGVGRPEFIRRMQSWLAEVKEATGTMIPPRAADLLKGIFWTCSLLDEPDLALDIGEATLSCLKKIPNVGMRSRKAGNAGLYALAQLPGMDGIIQLHRIRRRVRHRKVQTLIDSFVESAAQQRGLTSIELAELIVPDFDLQLDGSLSHRLGAYTARASFQPEGRTQLVWIGPDGRTLKSVPVAVKREHAGELAELRRNIKSCREMIAIQADRIEALFPHEPIWDYVTWRERYINHPLVHQVAARLIWLFVRGERISAGMWREDSLVGIDGQSLDWVDAQTQVRMWHPIRETPESVHRWREFILRNEIVQPFKQAHREIYPLTDAERQTCTYSNRFAAHILKQHQFAALCRQRGWSYTLQGAWDSHNTPFKDLPGTNLRVEFWIDAVFFDEMSPKGIYVYVSTDQVRFLTRTGDRVPLDLVPDLLLSETLRGVDLFIGVCSVGNDPLWSDQGELPLYRDYWRSYAFGELSPMANSRRELLAELLPRLNIAARCRLDERFLIVAGDLRTYKIHLGSGNILMEPNDQYLCIVPDRASSRKGEDLFLPFEGDSGFSLILSKAFLLANDTRIKDKTITRQIRVS